MAAVVAQRLIAPSAGLIDRGARPSQSYRNFFGAPLNQHHGLGSMLGRPQRTSSPVSMAVPRAPVEIPLEEYSEALEREYAEFFGEPMDAPISRPGDEDEDEEAAERPRRGRAGGRDRDREDRRKKDEFEETVIQVSRVTKVVKGGKQMSFRAVVIVGDKKGKVGVGVGKAKEVVGAVLKGSRDARRNVIDAPMTKYKSFPHLAQKTSGSATVLLKTAPSGTGVIAGGAVRVVLEMAGYDNARGKQLGSENPLNNARATVDALSSMQHFKDVAKKRGVTLEHLMS